MEKIKKIYPDSVNVVIATNNNYAPYTVVALTSLIAHTSDKNNYDIIVLETDVSDEYKNILSTLKKDNISVRTYNVNKFFERNEFWHYSYWSKETYSRLCIPEIMEDYEKVLYLDVDVIIQADVAELYNTDISDYLIAGNRNYGLITSIRHSPSLQYYYGTVFPIKNVKNLINAGVILMNIPKLKELQLEDKAIDILDQHKKLLFQDEDLLNKLCEDKILYIDSSWNFRYAVPEKLVYDWQLLDIAQQWATGLHKQNIIHYVSKEKPWDYPNLYYSEIWWAWAKKSPIYQQLLKAYFDKNSPEQKVQQ